MVGKVFWLGAVEAVDGVTRWQAEELLHALERKEFVQRARELRRSAARASTRSRHLLIRDVAYGQIPRAARSQKHQHAAALDRVARTRPRIRPRCSPTTTCRRSSWRRRPGLDPAVLSESARHALRDAGDRAAALYAVDAAERFYDAALRLWPEDDPERAQLLFRRAAPWRIWTAAIPSGWPRQGMRCSQQATTAKAAEAEMLLSKASGCRAAASSAPSMPSGRPPYRRPTAESIDRLGHRAHGARRALDAG